MADSRDVLIIGGGHNGLVSAFYLARAGLKTLILERRPQIGGAAITEEFYPGFRCSVLAHSAGPVQPEIARDMQLEKHGLRWIQPDVAVSALARDGTSLVVYRDLARAVEEIHRLSAPDAPRYREFQVALQKASRVVGKSLRLTPPELERPTKADLFAMLQLGRSLRGMGRANTYNLLRWTPMAVADLVSEFFEHELLRSAVAARGIFGTYLGPRSAGTGLVLLLRAASDQSPVGDNFFALGGTGAVTAAMAKAATAQGVQIRTHAEVGEIRVHQGAARGVVLKSGEEIEARIVVSGADPKRTLLGLLDPVLLSPSFARRLQNYRMRGALAKVNLALSEVPTFTALRSKEEALKGRIQVGDSLDYLERAFDQAKYGDFSRAPYLEVTLPSLSDPTLAPAGRQVMSIYMQYAPYNLRSATWESEQAALGDTVVNTLAQYA
ncbi:MAG: NAD(P)/FAD-dependent oxidoreductase, partial [Acidobacteria bacterium]|nr:NAD(P)/FAD-dependent oxidoreductase [Acidobacteriota bacterium]